MCIISFDSCRSDKTSRQLLDKQTWDHHGHVHFNHQHHHETVASWISISQCCFHANLILSSQKLYLHPFNLKQRHLNHYLWHHHQGQDHRIISRIKAWWTTLHYSLTSPHQRLTRFHLLNKKLFLACLVDTKRLQHIPTHPHPPRTFQKCNSSVCQCCTTTASTFAHCLR